MQVLGIPRIFPILLRAKLRFNPIRSFSRMTTFCHDGQNSLIVGGPTELIKSEEQTVNIIDIKRLFKEKLLTPTNVEYAVTSSGRFQRRSKRTVEPEESKSALSARESILSIIDHQERDGQLFHTMTAGYNKQGGNDCKSRVLGGKFRYHTEIEEAINKQIMSEMNAAFGYLSIASFFGRNDVGRKGSHKYFMLMSNEEIEHGLKLIEYQLSRGGVVKLSNVCINESVEWCSIAKALEIALEIEKAITEELVNIVCLTKKHGDYQTENFLITEFIGEQYESMNSLSRLLCRASRIAKDHIGDNIIDLELMQEMGHSKSPKK